MPAVPGAIVTCFVDVMPCVGVLLCGVLEPPVPLVVLGATEVMLDDANWAERRAGCLITM